MRKKLITLSLAAAMMLSLAACGKDKDDETTSSGKNPFSKPDVTSEASTEEAETTEAVAAANDKVGTYELYEYEANGQKMDHAMVESGNLGECSLTLTADGKAKLVLFDNPMEGTWTDTAFTMAGNMQYPLSFSDGTVIVDLAGVKYTLKKTGDQAGTASTDGDKTTEASAASGEGTEMDVKHGVYKIKFDPAAYRQATDADLLGDLIPLDDTKFPKLYVTSLDGDDRLKQEMDDIESVKAADSSAVEELTIDGHKAYIYKKNEDFLGYFYCLVIPFDHEIKSADGYYNQIDAVYIYGYGDTEDMIYNDTIKNIMLSVDIDESVESAAADAATEAQASEEAAASELGYGKSNPEATGHCTLDVLKATYAWQKEAGFGMTYEEFRDHFGCDGAPWYDVFEEGRHAYKWETEDGTDFLYVTFEVNSDGSETYKSCTYSTAVKGE